MLLIHVFNSLAQVSCRIGCLLHLHILSKLVNTSLVLRVIIRIHIGGIIEPVIEIYSVFSFLRAIWQNL